MFRFELGVILGVDAHKLSRRLGHFRGCIRFVFFAWAAVIRREDAAVDWVLLALIVVGPYLDALCRFVVGRIDLNPVARAAEGVFNGLFRIPFLVARFGFGEEFFTGSFSPLDLVPASILFLLLVFGLLRDFRSPPEIYGAIFGLRGWQSEGAVTRYDYRLYKVVLISSVV
jgi:hypothetical protein